MSKKRRETVRSDLSARLTRAPGWPVDFDPGDGRVWRVSNHVLTLRCGACHRPRALLLASVGDVTADAIAERSQWRPVSSDVVRNPCRCLWVTTPPPSAFRGAIVRAVRAGLGRVDEHKSLSVEASPPDPKEFHHSSEGLWVPRSEPGRTCPICDTPEGHHITAD